MKGNKFLFLAFQFSTATQPIREDTDHMWLLTSKIKSQSSRTTLQLHDHHRGLFGVTLGTQITAFPASQRSLGRAAL